jgi:hypothetical protein
VAKRVKQLSQEFAVVVIGVFVALAAESWWSEREDRRFEREIREDMVVEIESNTRILDADIALNEAARENIDSISDLADEALFLIPDADLSGQFGSGFFASAGFDPELGSVQALVESGNLGAVADRELRLRLSRWEGLLEQCRRKNFHALEFELSVSTLIVRAGSDLRWSEIERRELRTTMNNVLAYFDLRLGCQKELRGVAQDILAFLQESD